MRTMQITVGVRDYAVSDAGDITRLPYEFVTPTGGRAIKGAKELKPSLTKNGYLRLCISSGSMFAHRIVYQAFNGAIQEGMDVDHINGDRTDNRVANLRIATRTENALNRQRANANSSSGVRGVSFHKSTGQWEFAVSGDVKVSSRDRGVVVAASGFYHGR